MGMLSVILIPPVRGIHQSSVVYTHVSDQLTRGSPTPTHSQSTMTSSNGNILRVTGHLCGEFTVTGEFPVQRPVTRGFDVFYLRMNKRLSKQWWGWWFDTPSHLLWRHCNGASNRGVFIGFAVVVVGNDKLWNKHSSCGEISHRNIDTRVYKISSASPSLVFSIAKSNSVEISFHRNAIPYWYRRIV